MGRNDRALILLIDDLEQFLNPLVERLQGLFSASSVRVAGWVPTREDGDPEKKLDDYFNEGLAFVVTDFDLTRRGMGGFQGPAVQNWCHRRLIPVGDFSRRGRDRVATEPDLFQIRVPVKSDGVAATYIEAVFSGFRDIREWLEAPRMPGRSLSAVTADLIGRSDLEAEVSLYFSRLVTSNSAIRDHLVSVGDDKDESTTLDIMAYVVGHALLNLVIAFPGPILSRKILAAYLATTEEDAALFVETVKLRPYDGPFGRTQPLVWREDVDTALAVAVGEEPPELEDPWANYNRFALGRVLGREPSRHACERAGCEGKRGGYWCPFKTRTVCIRDDCSTSARAWIPDGADLCRVEADFFETFEPLLGL